MASKYSSSLHDQDTLVSKEDLHLCPKDQENPGSCNSQKCDNLHMCYNYLLKRECRQFELNGKCSHSHSLYTFHNLKILNGKFRLSLKDKDIFEKLSEQLRISKSNSSQKTLSNFGRTSISNDDDREVELTSKPTSVTKNGRGRGRPFSDQRTPEPSFSKEISSSSSNNQLSTDKKRLSISHRLSTLADPSSSSTIKSNTKDFSSILTNSMTTNSLDLSTDRLHKQVETRQFLSQRSSLPISKQDKKEKYRHNDRSSLSNNIDERVEFSSKTTATSQDESSTIPFINGSHRTKKEGDPNDLIKTRTEMKYIFRKDMKNEELCYLLGPGRQYLIENESYQIFPSGYCRLMNRDQEKQIEKKIQRLLPDQLCTDCVQLPDDNLAFISCTSAAEKCFEQNDKDYAVISKPYTASFSIEVIFPPKTDLTRPLARVLSPRLSSERENSYLSSSDGKFHIPSTDSSIDVIAGDITGTRVDLMVCVSTSRTLLESVLFRAGKSIKSQFSEQSRLNNTVFLDGGHTAAKRILFIPWKLEVQSSDKVKAQKSLSDLVKWCISEAHRLKMKSISFPSIGTGDIGLDVDRVCESMISAASECLHQYKMDVLFVIYQSSGSKSNQQTYEVFRTYLDNLCKEMKSKRTGASSESHILQSLTIPVERSEFIQRKLECKRIWTVSDSSNVPKHHQLLINSLDKLSREAIFDLDSVQPEFTKQVDSLIDVCLSYHVLPCIDFSKSELTLWGDRDSCAQCFANLIKPRPINKYSIVIENGKNTEEIKLDMFMSMKIDEAFAINNSKINIEYDPQTTFYIDLKSLQVNFNSGPQVARLVMKQIDDSKFVRPKSWSPSSLMIDTNTIRHSSFISLECVHIFEQTMPQSEWDIERVDAIENWPLYVHYARKKSKDEILAFHGCSFSSVQSIIHYGLHSNYDEQSQGLILLTRDALNSHICGTRRSTDGKHYIFAVQLTKKTFNNDVINLSNKDAYLALPIYLIVYQPKNDLSFI